MKQIRPVGLGIFSALCARAGLAALLLCLAGAAYAADGDDSAMESGTYLALDPMAVSVTRDFRVRGVLQIDAGLEIADPDLRRRAEILRPRLRDAYALALADYAERHHRLGAAPDAGRIGDMMQDATDRVLGQGGADLLLGMVILQ